MRPDSLATRARLIAAAEQLFADRGIDAVSMNEVQRAAGQKNKSALQYHFGTKEQLLQAILEKHTPGIELRRHRLLDGVEAAGTLDLRALMEALVLPVAEKLDDPDGGRAYLAIFGQIVGGPRTSTFWNDARLGNRGADRLQRLLLRVVPGLPAPVRMARYLLVTELLFHGLSDFGRLVTSDPQLFPPSARELFVSNLVDVLTAVASAEVSGQTRALLPPHVTATADAADGTNETP
ncbi:MAG: TetR family transcriptional regulator [Polyangiales bacterium]|nr:TetR/AcrR family transcriptional regulator [Myxococcales bacterium]MCB9658083.1 TetR/AcrR family transcriptional regulator [Sandaracinaceae bacterium]